MIVAAIEIENYKQYAGAHRIEFPEQGIVAVTGPNGAGKTTLFEAIEWCLYCPRTIPQASVPPHDGVGRTVVRVTLEDSNDGKRFCVQRELRASGTQAEVYLEEAPDQPIVQGTREVTRFVARHLVGLPHGAFVSTFFTKQRELQFFGDRTATDRRTEIGKLLGLEAVREAQREIGEGRTAARSLADARRGEYERRLGERDLAAEAEDAERNVKLAAEQEVAADKAALAAAEAAERARGELDRLRDLQAKDASFARKLAELAGLAATSAARRDGAVAQLERLERRAAERMELAALAGAVDRLVTRVERLEAERERARQLQALQEEARRAAETECAIAHRLERLVSDHRDAAQGLAGWKWSASDVSDCAGAAARLKAIALSLEPGTLRDRLERMQEASRLSNDVDLTSATLARFVLQRDRLVAERDKLLAEGDPTLAVEEASVLLREARKSEQKARMSLAAARAELNDVERLIAGLHEHSEDTMCPTCTRPLGPEEARRLIGLMEPNVQILKQQVEHLSGIETVAIRQVEASEQEEAEARTRKEGVQSLTDRLTEGQRLIEEAEQRQSELTARLRDALAAIDAERVPTIDEIEEARHIAERAQQVAGLAGLLDRLHDEALAARQAEEDATERIRALGEVAFDDADLRSAMDELRHARRAAAQVEQIDVELANHGLYERQRVAEERELTRLAGEQAAVVAEREALAFDPETLAAAQAAEKASRLAAHDAREDHAAARQAVREAQAARDRTLADHEQLQELIAEADRKLRQADDLTRMYDEFGEFDRYVARHVGPLLAETTERMLGQVTSGKFDHVRFDENYGIEVFDGDEAFPIASFSGGERDVVSLCARLALSEVVGSAAVRPPRFLVLDEVFGSLDSERRSQLLETLGGLAHAGHFRQMFIISHVDDVQQSPVMTEAWTIEERDGVSHVVRPELFSARP